MGFGQTLPLGSLQLFAEQTFLPPGPTVQVWLQAVAQLPTLVKRSHSVLSMQFRLTCSARVDSVPVQVNILGGDTKRLPKTAPSWLGYWTSSPPGPIAVRPAAAETSSTATWRAELLVSDIRQA